MVLCFNIDLNYVHTPLQLNAFCDGDRTGDLNDIKCTTGFVILFHESPISWCNKKQSAVSRSSTEVEYRNMANTITEIVWLSHLLNDLPISCGGTYTAL